MAPIRSPGEVRGEDRAEVPAEVRGEVCMILCVTIEPPTCLNSVTSLM